MIIVNIIENIDISDLDCIKSFGKWKVGIL